MLISISQVQHALFDVRLIERRGDKQEYQRRGSSLYRVLGHLPQRVHKGALKAVAREQQTYQL